MMTQKNRRLANQEVMIKRRNEIIKHQTNKIVELETILSEIKVFASMNKYNHPEIYLRKIKELVDDYQSNN